MHGASSIQISQAEIGDEFKVVSEDGSFTAILLEASAEEGLTFEHLFSGLTTVISFSDVQDYDFYPRGDTIRRLVEVEHHQLEKAASEVVEAFVPEEVSKDTPPTEIPPDEAEFALTSYPLGDFHTGDEITVVTMETTDLDLIILKVDGDIYTVQGETGVEVELNASEFQTDYTYDFYPRGDTIQRMVDAAKIVTPVDNSQDFFELYDKYQRIPAGSSQVALLAFDELSRLADTPELKETLEFLADERNQKVLETYSADSI